MQRDRRHRGHREHAGDARRTSSATASTVVRDYGADVPADRGDTPASSTRCGPTSSTTPSTRWTGTGTLRVSTRADGDARRRRDRRHRPGHAARGAGARVRAVLHHQGRRARAPASASTSPGASSSSGTAARSPSTSRAGRDRAAGPAAAPQHRGLAARFQPGEDRALLADAGVVDTDRDDLNPRLSCHGPSCASGTRPLGPRRAQVPDLRFDDAIRRLSAMHPDGSLRGTWTPALKIETAQLSRFDLGRRGPTRMGKLLPRVGSVWSRAIGAYRCPRGRDQGCSYGHTGSSDAANPQCRRGWVAWFGSRKGLSCLRIRPIRRERCWTSETRSWDSPGGWHSATCRWLLLVAEFDDRDGADAYGLSTTSAWLAHHCGLAERTARDHVRVARALAAFPALAASMGAGRISYSHARTIAGIATAGEDALVADLLVLAEYGTIAQLEAMIAGLRSVDRDYADPIDPRPTRGGRSTSGTAPMPGSGSRAGSTPSTPSCCGPPWTWSAPPTPPRRDRTRSR